MSRSRKSLRKRMIIALIIPIQKIAIYRNLILVTVSHENKKFHFPIDKNRFIVYI